MFGHQDNTDNVSVNDPSQDQHQPSHVDNYIQEFNNNSPAPSSKPLDPPTYNASEHEPLLPAGPTALPEPPTPPPSDDSQVNLDDQHDDQIVNLVDLKTKALDELYPIVHKLDLTAEENFKTLMMMIQATDNKDLIGQAYTAAEKIEDEGTRARALLDIVNEINYFTNHPSLDQ